MKATSKLLSMFTPGEKKKEFKTSETHPHEVDYVDSSIKEEVLPYGRIGMMMCPGRSKKLWRRDLIIDLDRIRKEFDVNVVITLVRNLELNKMKIGDVRFFREIKARDMDYRHHPIKDKWLPGSNYKLCETVEYIVAELHKGKNVAIHCNGGKGRSGLVVACTLMSQSVDPGKSIKTVRKTRGGTLKNPLQIAYIYRFPKIWKKFKKGTLKKSSKSHPEIEGEGGEEEEETEGEDEMKVKDKRLEQLKGMKDMNKTI